MLNDVNQQTISANNSARVFSESKVMHLLRTVAIISVICAHCATIVDNSVLWNYIFFRLFTAFGIIGVPIFFFSSGYFFFINQRKNYADFLHHKIKTFFIPWIVATTLVYFYVALRKDGLQLNDYILFLIGINNYTYFLSVLLIFFLCLLKSKFSTPFIFIAILISLLSMTLTTTRTLDSINAYSNPFNWLIYFITGIAFKKWSLLKQVAAIAIKSIYLNMTIFIFINIVFIVYQVRVNYFSVGGYFYIFSAWITFLGLVSKYQEKLSGFAYIGKESMAIYLIHFPFAGFLVYLTNRFNWWYLLPARPLIILISVLLIIGLYKKLARRFSVEKFCYPLIGLS